MRHGQLLTLLALCAVSGAAQMPPRALTGLVFGGGRVEIRYRPVPLTPATLAALHTRPRARAFFNARVLCRLLRLKTTVTLRHEKEVLPPGTYDGGFHCQRLDRWDFVVLNREGKVCFRAPLRLQGVDLVLPVLSVSLLPGRAPRTLVVALRYGPLRSHLRLRWETPASP